MNTRAWIVFLDESGVSLLPGIRRTYSPRGRTPLLRHRCGPYSKPRWRAHCDFAPVEDTVERLALLTLVEAHDLLGLLLTVVQEDGPVSPEAGRLAREIAARIPSEN
ncbi:DUF6417 family protein [Streptomyces sp. NPDC050523]|uniref:DUF6417 family protein n=1 Tax=Streptomyces sp. NPDC050523 TaxID=3365622 RepID=UPI0037B44824